MRHRLCAVLKIIPRETGLNDLAVVLPAVANFNSNIWWKNI